MRRPVALYPAAILALAVAGIFFLRFTATGSFDTRASLVEGPLKALLQPAEKQARADKKPGEGEEPGSNDETSKELDKNRDYAGEPDAQKEETSKRPRPPKRRRASSKRAKAKASRSSRRITDAAESAKPGEFVEQGKEQDGQQQESLLDKLKDASRT